MPSSPESIFSLDNRQLLILFYYHGTGMITYYSFICHTDALMAFTKADTMLFSLRVMPNNASAESTIFAYLCEIETKFENILG
jgi:hypothetical protein